MWQGSLPSGSAGAVREGSWSATVFGCRIASTPGPKVSLEEHLILTR